MIKYDETEVVVRGEPLDEIWWQGRQWAVTAFGLESRDGLYTIEANRLCEDHKTKYPHSRIAHMGGKSWIDIDDFATAWFVACAMHRHRLTKAERIMLEDHHTQGKTAELRRPYFEKARSAIGIPPGSVNLTQLDAICDKADQLAQLDGL